MTLQKLKVHCSQEISWLPTPFELGQSLKCWALPTSAPTVCHTIQQLTQGMSCQLPWGMIFLTNPLIKARHQLEIEGRGHSPAAVFVLTFYLFAAS